jgi:argininosuccinate synthase
VFSSSSRRLNTLNQLCSAIAHGTGAGNDQIRFDLIFRYRPEIEIITQRLEIIKTRRRLLI